MGIELADEYNISSKILDDLFDGVESDLKERSKFIKFKKRIINLFI